VAPSFGARSLIQQRERELHEATTQHLAALEAAVTARDNEIDLLKSKISTLKEDYTHNLRLFEERDAEIDRLERDLASSQQTSREVSQRADRLLAEMSALQARADGERARTAEMEALHSSELRRIRETLDSARSARDEDVRHWREQIEHVRVEAAAALRNREHEAHEERRQLLEAGDAAVESIRRDSKRREDELSSLLRLSEQRLAEQRSQCNELTVSQSALAAKLDVAVNAQRAAENDLTEMRASMHALRSDLNEKLSAAISAKEAAIKSKTALADEYEHKLNNVVESLRSVEAEFQAQGRRFETDLKAQSAQSQSRLTMAEEQNKILESTNRDRQEREKELMSALKEAEINGQRASDKVLQLELLLRSKDAEYMSYKSEKESMCTTLEIRLTEAVRTKEVLQSKIDSADEIAAQLKADNHALEHRAKDLESELNLLNASWEKKWTNREQLALAAQEEEARAVKGLREELDRQLQQAREAAAANDKRSLLRGGGGGGSGDALINEISMTGASTDASSSTAAASADSLLLQLASLESDRNGLIVENATLKESLQVAKSQAFAHNIKMEQVEERLAAATLAVRNQVAAEAAEATANAEMEAERLRRRCAELETQIARFREVISDMRKHVEDLHAQHDVAMKRQMGVVVTSTTMSSDTVTSTLPLSVVNNENSSENVTNNNNNSKKVGTEDEEEDKHSSLVNGYSNNAAGGKSEELAEAAAYKASAEVMLASLASERDELTAGLTRLQNYVALLQSRVQALNGGTESNSSGAEEEAFLLRNHTKEQQVALASLRFTLRRTQQELAKLKGTHVYELNRRGASSILEASTTISTSQQQQHQQHYSSSSSETSDDLVIAQSEVSRLREERARLLEVSNKLRGQLNRAEQTIASLTSNPLSTNGRQGSDGGRDSHMTTLALRPNPSKANSSSSSLSSSKPSNEVEEISVPASRLALLEESLAKVMRHNAQLSDNLTRILADHHHHQQLQLNAMETGNDDLHSNIPTSSAQTASHLTSTREDEFSSSSSATTTSSLLVGGRGLPPGIKTASLSKPAVPKQAPLSAALSAATLQVIPPVPQQQQQQQQQSQSAVAVAARAKMAGRTIKSVPTNYAELKNSV
jgi:hypothetical protein